MLISIFVKFTIIVDGIEPMEFAFPEEDLAISRYNVMTCKTTISLMFEPKQKCVLSKINAFTIVYNFFLSIVQMP